MESIDIRDSPYITNWDLVPPSPTRSNIEFDQASPFDSAFPDNNNQGANPLTSPAYPNTSSYNGSYLNSPFSQHSDLPEIDFQILNDPTATSGLNDYEPSEYDPPNQASSLLMFSGDTDFVSPHFSPNNLSSDGYRGSPFDQASPASSTGLDDNNHGGRHSRASSVTSNQHSPSAQQPSSHSPRPSLQPSPRIDALNSFGNMTVHTPNWGSQPLPNAPPSNIGTESLPLQQKPQTPPRLTMPSGLTYTSEVTAVPKINAPDADDGGPSFNIVPATPVTTGDAGGRQHIPYRQTLTTLTQDVELVTSDNGMNEQQYQQPQQQQQQRTSPYGSPHILGTDITDDLFLPERSDIRPRRNSDGWQASSFLDNSQNQLGLPEGYVTQPQLSMSMNEHHRLQSFTFGGNTGSNGFLATNADSIRRTVSDSLAAPRLHRHSRSEEIRPIPTFATAPVAGYHGQSNSIGSGPFIFPPSSHADFIQRQHFLHPNDLPSSTSNPALQTNQGRRSLSPSVGHVRRASSGTRSGRGAEVWGTQAEQLAATHALGVRRMSPYPTPNASPRINYNELEELNNDLGLSNQNLGIGVGNTNGLNLGAGLGLGLSVGVSSVGADGIPGIGEPPVSAGYTEEVAIAGRNSYTRDDVSSHGGGHQRAESVASVNTVDAAGHITKHNVTTGRTANASKKRRKQEATFACPVPGCGSTFTRGFNLKGHMRSHYEQKPYKCHWPGCDKGFARQHDCKRHEQLHSNYRPFICDGCGKNFARMDALNRHLRSEAGAECARAAEEKKEGGFGGDLSGSDHGKMEDDDEKPLEVSPPPPPFPRRRNTGGGGTGIGNPAGGVGMLGLSDEMWSVAV